MSSEKSFWYRLGFALERAKRTPAEGKRALAGLAERRVGGEAPRRAAKRRAKPSDDSSDWPSVDDLIASGIVAAAAKTLDVWRPRHKTGAVRLARAGAAGAAAALVVEVIRPLFSGRAELPSLGADLADRMLQGAGQGLVYGAVVEPRLPGSALAKGTLYGSAEYAVVPAGGLSRLLGTHAPLGRIPVLSGLVEQAGGHDRDYLEHVAFGISLALLYGSSSNNGIRIEVDE